MLDQRDSRVFRGRMFYINGSNRVVSFKLPEELLDALDRYVGLLGFKNRSDLIRTLLGAFIYVLERAEKYQIVHRGDFELSIEVQTTDGTSIKEIIDLRNQIPYIKNMYEKAINIYH